MTLDPNNPAPLDVAPAARAGSSKDAVSNQNLFALKALVIGLAAVMAILMITIIARIVYLVASPKSSAAPGDLAIPLRLPAGATVSGASTSGGRLTIHYVHGGTTWIAIHDGETGAVLRSYEIVSETPERNPAPETTERPTTVPKH